MFHMLKSRGRGYSVELIHWNSSHWREMACGGRDSCCQDFRASLRVIRHLLEIPAAKSQPAAPVASAPSTSMPSTSSSPAPTPTSRTLIPSLDLTDDPVRTSHGASVERRLDRIFDILERQVCLLLDHPDRGPDRDRGQESDGQGGPCGGDQCCSRRNLIIRRHRQQLLRLR